MKALILPLCLLCSGAQAATGLAIVTREAIVNGKLVKDVTTSAGIVYATPKAGDYVRVAASKDQVWTTGVWKALTAVQPGDKIEVCTTDVAEETGEFATTGNCKGWDVVALQRVNTTGTLQLTWHTPVFGNGMAGQQAKQSDLVGYQIYSGVKDGTLGFAKQVPVGTLTTTLAGYGNGIYTLGVAALYRAGAVPPIAPLESAIIRAPDIEVSIQVPVAPAIPGAPTDVSITSVTVGSP